MLGDTSPYPHDNRFAIRFVFDFTHKPTGKRTTMDEIGLFTVDNGKIIREEFFYTMG
jgi:ketosteroid isomerase-like protein